MTDDNNIAQIAARRLVFEQHPNEKSVQLWLAMLLVSLGYEVKLEYQVPSGHMDIFLPRCRVVIETKPQGEVDPNARRDPDSGETQFEQCERYVREEWERVCVMMDLFALDALPYRAILTDGQVWWMWQWEIQPNRKLGKARRKVKERVFSSVEGVVAGVQDLIGNHDNLRCDPETEVWVNLPLPLLPPPPGPVKRR